MSFYLYIIIAFILGGIPFGLLVGYLFGHGDIRTQGSGNIGATNVWRIAGPGAAALVFIGDIGKGVAAVLLAGWMISTSWPVPITTACLIGGCAAVLGHMFSPFLGFRGGKGVNTALGVFVSLVPLETGIAFVVFLVVVFISRFISLGSIVAALVLASLMWVERLFHLREVADAYLIAGTIVAALIIVAHRQNIARLMKGTENKFAMRNASR